MENSGVFIGSSENSAKNSDILRSLLHRANSGDERAFGEIYNLYFQKIYRFIYFRVSHKELAEDLTEDVFIKAYRKLSTIQDPAAFEGWLYQIARNTVIDHYRDKRTLVALEEVENTLEYESNVIDELQLQHQQKLILTFLKKLAPDQQQVLKMKFFEELENPEIARILNKTEGAIRVIQHRALLKLQELIADLTGTNDEKD